MTSYGFKKTVSLKIVYNKKKIQIFGMNMPITSSREAKYSPLMKYAFFASLDEINVIFIQRFEYPLYIVGSFTKPGTCTFVNFTGETKNFLDILLFLISL